MLPNPKLGHLVSGQAVCDFVVTFLTSCFSHLLERSGLLLTFRFRVQSQTSSARAALAAHEPTFSRQVCSSFHVVARRWTDTPAQPCTPLSFFSEWPAAGPVLIVGADARASRRGGRILYNPPLDGQGMFLPLNQTLHLLTFFPHPCRAM